jgi:hypothetical protein
MAEVQVPIALSNPYKARLLAVKRSILQLLTCRLFVNDIVPADGMTLADFEEATFNGYNRQPLNMWLPAYVNVDHAEMETRDVTFGSLPTLPPQRVYGWYAVDDLTGYAMGRRLYGPIPFFAGAPPPFNILKFRIFLAEYSIGQ